MRAYNATDFQSAMRGPDPRMVELAYLQERLGAAATLLAQSQPLVGTVLTERGSMEVLDAMAAFGIDTVVYRFGTSVVTDDGVACLVHHYPLPHARLEERQDWASHLAELPWVNLWDALRALAVARQIGARRTPYEPRGDDGDGGDGAHPS